MQARKDTFHDIVRRALEKDGWAITHDPLILRYELGNLYVDLGAEKVLAAERAGQKIAVEVKSFLQNSAVSEFHTALGQFISYRILLAEQYPDYVLYLAIPLDAYTSFFATQLAQGIIHSQQLKLIVYKPQEEVIDKWQT
jgi:gamma-glutamyl:cysteine ligase YbdK (ATP-grasp superfamily)